jgi:2-dehydropantoate 2-reductase
MPPIDVYKESLMKVCVFGAGAVGGHIATRMSAAGLADVSVVARGAHLDAIRKQGLTLKSGSSEIHAKPKVATDDAATLPQQDVVLVTLKAHALPQLASTLEKLTAPQGTIVFMLNGLPWWWPYGRSDVKGPLRLLDPDGELWTRLREKTLGCVIYSPNELEGPGVIVHHGGNRWVIGEPSDQATPRLRTIVDLFNKSGLPAEIPSDVRAEIWRKLMNNASGNSLAALTRLGHHAIASDPDLKQLGIRIMRETLDVAAAVGSDLRSEIDVEKIAGRATPGPAPKPSMLQDVLLGRPLEVEAHLGQTQAFARERKVPVPTIDLVLPLLRGLDRSIRAGQ